MRPRSALLLASLFTRASGFVTAFALARFAGIQELGLYSAVVNTAGMLAGPASGMLGNNVTTQTASAGRSPGTPRPASLVLASLALALTVGVVVAALFLLILPREHVAASAVDVRLLVTVGLLFAVAQCLLPVLVGAMNGTGRYLPLVRVTGGVSLACTLLAVPVVLLWGLTGALGLLLVASLSPVVLLARPALDGLREGFDTRAWSVVLDAVRAGLPSGAAAATAAFGQWFCFVHVAQQHHGIAAVGLLAVATQWYSLLLMPVTSWGGMTIQLFTEARDADGGRDATAMRARYAALLGRLMRKSLVVTGVLAALVAAASVPLASVYTLRDDGLVPVLLVTCATALLYAAANVYERALLVLGRQPIWFIANGTALVVQVAVTVAFVHNGAWVIPVGLFCGQVASIIVNAIGLRRGLAAWSPSPRSASALR